MNLPLARFPALVLLLGVALGAPQARAETSTADRVAAEALYEEGRKLFNDARFAEACGKFEESQRLDPGVGTLLYLGSCREKGGKLASAWISFREAATAARAANQPDREKTALRLAEAVEPRLARLQIVVPPEHDLPGLQIRRDGNVVGRGLWGSAIPVDLGVHALEFSAPSRRTARLSLPIDKEGQTVTFRLPALEAEAAPVASASVAPAASSSPVAPPLAPPALATSPSPSSRPTLALVVGGVGAVGLGLGAYFGLRAIDQWNDSRPQCPADRCSRDGHDLATAAGRSGNLSTLFFSLGVVGVGAGATLWLVQPSSSSARTSPSLSVGVAGPSLVARGSW
jgi:hypothetical protein